MPAIAVSVFALSWWAACYLVGRDPARAAAWRAAAALASYAAGMVAWTVAPGSALAEILFCVPALFWAGTAVALLPGPAAERRLIDLGGAVLALLFLVLVVALPSPGRLVVLAPLFGGLVLLWRFGDRAQPPMLPAALTLAAVLYAAGLVGLLLPIGAGAPELVLAAIGVDLLMLGFLAAVADAIDLGERLWPDLIRSTACAVAAAVVVGAPATLTMISADSRRPVVLLQFAVVAAAMTTVGFAGPVRRGLDALVFRGDERLRRDRWALLLLAEALPRHRQRHLLITTREEDFLRYTRQALTNLGHLSRLMRSPLTDLPAVDRRLSGLTVEQPLARAMELRAVLQDGVDRLRPAGEFATTAQWRHYSALYFCVVLGFDPSVRRPRADVLDRETRRAIDWLHRYVPRRTLRRWQSEAASIVARRLWDELTGTDPRGGSGMRTPTTRST